VPQDRAYWPPKPSGMRSCAYEAICDRPNAESEGLNMGLLRVVERLMRFHK
jgi:hypothetical protein